MEICYFCKIADAKHKILWWFNLWRPICDTCLKIEEKDPRTGNKYIDIFTYPIDGVE